MDNETRTVLEQIINGMDAGFAHVNQRMDAGFAHVNQRMDAGFDALRVEMRDGFRSVDERLKSLERDVNLLWTESKHHTVAINGLTERVASLEKRVDSMSDDMRQRFRLVIERIAALEQAPR